MESGCRQQLDFIQRTIALCQGVPHSYPVTLTAGDLLALLAAFADQDNVTELAVRPQADEQNGAKEARRPSRPGDISPHRRGPNSATLRKLHDFFARARGSRSISQIVAGTGLADMTVGRALLCDDFEPDPDRDHLWRPRATAAASPG